MVKCPFCGFANEDGALFCEQCKSDISSVAPTPAAPPMTPPTPMPESLPSAEEVPMALVEATPDEAPVMAAIIEDTPAEEAPPVALVEEEPVAAIAESIPLEPMQPMAVAGIVVEEPIADAPPPPAKVAEPRPSPKVMETPPPAPAVAAVAAAVSTPAKPAAAAGAAIPAGSEPKLVVQRGLKVGEEYGIFAGENYIGRADEKPVDVDLTFQEPEDRVWTSRQHALLVWDDATGVLTVEDLNSSNGTFVNRERVYPGQPRQLFVGNTVQIGTVHMRVKV